MSESDSTSSIFNTLTEIVETEGGSVVPVSAADVVVCVGEPALFSIARTIHRTPILAVAAGTGPHVVSKPDAPDALQAVFDGNVHSVEHPTLEIDVGGTVDTSAVYDVSLVTEDAARISEYAVFGDGESLATVRSDGMVVSTPAGSAGYAKAAGGPVIAPGAGLSIVPISPFTTHPEAWVARDTVRLQVMRDDSVSLIADDRMVRSLESSETVRIRRADSFILLKPDRTAEY